MVVHFTKAKIHTLAAQHGAAAIRTALDDWAEAVSRLSGDDVTLDETELLIVRLRQKGVFTGIEATMIHARYLREIRESEKSGETVS